MGAAKGFLGTIAKSAPIESLEDEKYRDKSIAYDLAVLRHRGKRCLDVETIARLQNDTQPGQPVPLELWQPLVDYIVKWATIIASLVGKATFVLDGEALMSKSSEGERRRTDRMKSFSDAIAHQKKREEDGIDVDGKELHKLFAGAVDASIDAVTYAIIEAMSDGSWDFIQAPNEADAQLAKLALSVDLVVCNDSDLIPYGCPVVMIIKTDGHGVLKGSMYVIAEAVGDERHIFFGLSRGQLIAVCLVVGCDFSAGIFKIGWKKAPKLVRESWDESDPCNIERLIAAAELVRGAVVPTDFQQQWNGGWATFNHQRAFDAATETIEYLHQPAPEREEAVAKLVGHPVRDVQISKAIAHGFLHPSTRPWIEVVAARDDAGQLEDDARIISRESESLSRQLNHMSERRRGALSGMFSDALKELERSIDRRRDANRLDPVVVDWEKKERVFESNREAYRRINEEEGRPPVDEKHVIQWTVLAIQQLQKDHGDGFSLYALKAMPDERDVPLRNEDTAYFVDTSRNPTVMRSVYIDEADAGAGTDTAREEAAVIGGRHFRPSEIVRYGEHASLDTSGILVHRFLQYSTIFQGDAGAYLGELLATRVCFVMMGGGTGRVLNRAYFGSVQDPFGLKRHCFGISAIANFVAGLEAGTMGICNSQQAPVLRQFCQNLACDFTLLSLVGKSRKRDRSNYMSELQNLAKRMRLNLERQSDEFVAAATSLAESNGKHVSVVMEELERCRKAQVDNEEQWGEYGRMLSKLASRMLNGEQQSELTGAVTTFAKSRGKNFDDVMQQVANTTFSYLKRSTHLSQGEIDDIGANPNMAKLLPLIKRHCRLGSEVAARAAATRSRDLSEREKCMASKTVAEIAKDPAILEGSSTLVSSRLATIMKKNGCPRNRLYDEYLQHVIREKASKAKTRTESNGPAPAAKAMPNVWRCDICREVVFGTYDKAVAHESGCRGRPATAAVDMAELRQQWAEQSKDAAGDKLWLENLNELRLKSDGTIDYSSLDEDAKKKMQQFVSYPMTAERVAWPCVPWRWCRV